MTELEKTRLEQVLQHMETNPVISSSQAAELLDVGKKTASRLLLQAEKMGIFKSQGKTRFKVYLKG